MRIDLRLRLGVPKASRAGDRAPQRRLLAAHCAPNRSSRGAQLVEPLVGRNCRTAVRSSVYRMVRRTLRVARGSNAPKEFGDGKPKLRRHVHRHRERLQIWLSRRKRIGQRHPGRYHLPLQSFLLMHSLRASCSPSLNYNWGYWLEDPTPPGSTVYDGGVELAAGFDC